MANRYVKRYLPSLIIREMQDKITTRYQLTPVSMTVTKKTRNNYWWESGEKGSLVNCWWEWKLGASLWWKARKCLKNKKKKERTIQQFYFWVYIWQKWRHYLKKIICIPNVHWAYSQQPRHRNHLRVQWQILRYREAQRKGKNILLSYLNIAIII